MNTFKTLWISFLVATLSGLGVLVAADSSRRDMNRSDSGSPQTEHADSSGRGMHRQMPMMSEMMKDREMMQNMCRQMAANPEAMRMMCHEMMTADGADLADKIPSD